MSAGRIRTAKGITGVGVRLGSGEGVSVAAGTGDATGSPVPVLAQALSTNPAIIINITILERTNILQVSEWTNYTRGFITCFIYCKPSMKYRKEIKTVLTALRDTLKNKKAAYIAAFSIDEYSRPIWT